MNNTNLNGAENTKNDVALAGQAERCVIRWHPIETAPDDESFYAADTNGRYYLGSMIDGEFYNASGNNPLIPPTHWMPLPEQPNTL